MKNFSLFFSYSFHFLGYSQRESLQTKFTTETIVIDGKLEESVWETVPVPQILSHFNQTTEYQFQGKKTIVKVLYDNDAII
jgi:hypothetical protein